MSKRHRAPKNTQMFYYVNILPMQVKANGTLVLFTYQYFKDNFRFKLLSNISPLSHRKV